MAWYSPSAVLTPGGVAAGLSDLGATLASIPERRAQIQRQMAQDARAEREAAMQARIQEQNLAAGKADMEYRAKTRPLELSRMEAENAKAAYQNEIAPAEAAQRGLYRAGSGDLLRQDVAAGLSRFGQKQQQADQEFKLGLAERQAQIEAHEAAQERSAQLAEIERGRAVTEGNVFPSSIPEAYQAVSGWMDRRRKAAASAKNPPRPSYDPLTLRKFTMQGDILRDRRKEAVAAISAAKTAAMVARSDEEKLAAGTALQAAQTALQDADRALAALGADSGATPAPAPKRMTMAEIRGASPSYATIPDAELRQKAAARGITITD